MAGMSRFSTALRRVFDFVSYSLTMPRAFAWLPIGCLGPVSSRSLTSCRSFSTSFSSIASSNRAGYVSSKRFHLAKSCFALRTTGSSSENFHACTAASSSLMFLWLRASAMAVTPLCQFASWVRARTMWVASADSRECLCRCGTLRVRRTAARVCMYLVPLAVFIASSSFLGCREDIDVPTSERCTLTIFATSECSAEGSLRPHLLAR
mmetsp:Transcript_63526/g.151491  ORF Transcript_63526/g.151491 Transcript_63526/m.151491 type:complete len:208 (+) Transcript_63526:1700-2323(+)